MSLGGRNWGPLGWASFSAIVTFALTYGIIWVVI